MNRLNEKHGSYCILIIVVMIMALLPWNVLADGEILYLKGISLQHLAESGEIGIKVSATNGIGEGVKMKPSDLQVLINGQPVEAVIDRNSRQGHIFVVDYSLSAENQRWTYVTESVSALMKGLLTWADARDEISVVWAGETNEIETLSKDDLESVYRGRRENVRSNVVNLYDGIAQAVEQAQQKIGGYDYYNIYILTDGQDSGSSVTLDYLSKKVQDSNSPISVFICCYYNGARASEIANPAETARKALNQFASNLDGVYDSFDIQRGKTVETYVKDILNRFSDANYGVMNVRVALNEVPLDRKNGQTEVYVGLVSGGTAKRKTIYLPVDQLPLPAKDTTESPDLQASIAEKEQQIETLVSSIALKDAKIETLEKNAEEQSSKIETLEADLNESTSRIELLEADVTEKDTKIKTLETDATKMAAQVKTLESENVKQAARITTLETDVTQKEEQIKTLESDIAGKAKEIETLKTDVKEKTGRIESLETDTAEKAKQITTLATELSGKINEIETLQTTVNDKDSEIATLTATVAEKESRIESLEADVSEKETQIEGLQGNISAQAAQLKIFKQKILDEGVAVGYNGQRSLQVIVPTKNFVIERLSIVTDIAAIAAVTIDNDPNGQLGKEGQYIEQIYFSSPLVDPEYTEKKDFDVISAGTACGGSIEVYRTITDAMERDRHLAYYDGSSSSSGSHIVVGTIVIRTSSGLSLVDQRKLENEILEALIAE